MVDLLLSAGLLLAQAAPCGTYGSPSSPGGCSLPAPNGGSYLLQDVYGQTWVQSPINQFNDNTYPNDDNDQ
jgi:hypothetical protein